MKRTVLICLSCLILIMFASCSQNNTTNGETEPENTESTAAADIYADSEFTGVWYNADSTEEKVEFELNADGTATFRGESTGTWEPNDVDGITVKVTVDGKETTMNGYFVIAGDGFVARYNEENQHYIDDGEGEKQLEVMITENTCVDCIKQ